MATRRVAAALYRANGVSQFTRRLACRGLSTTPVVRSNDLELAAFQRKIEDMSREYERFNAFSKDTAGRKGEDREAHYVRLNDKQHLSPELDRKRVVPKDSSFFMANPPHEEIVRQLNDILQYHINVPTIPKDQADRKTTWLSEGEYKAMLGGEHFKPKYYKQVLKLLNRLSLMDPQLMPDEVRDALAPFTKRASDSLDKKKHKTLDHWGRAIAVGRRKTSSARIQLVKSSENAAGQMLINGKALDVYFPRLAHRISVMYPLQVCGAQANYNCFVTVTGGGPSGQAGAIMQGISRALVIHNPLFLTRLSRAKALQRDPRVKERKKPGKPKARKSYTWVKR